MMFPYYWPFCSAIKVSIQWWQLCSIICFNWCLGVIHNGWKDLADKAEHQAWNYSSLSSGILHQNPPYCQISNIRHTKYQNLNVSRLVLQLSLPNLSWEWRCSWSSADRRCSNYIWVINNLTAHKGATYIRDLMVNDAASVSILLASI